MSSFNNRVLVASLFLPTTTASTIHGVDANGHDPRHSHSDRIRDPPLKSIKENAPGTSPTSPRAPGFNISPPAKHRPVIPQSIVDDLTSKVSTWYRRAGALMTDQAPNSPSHRHLPNLSGSARLERSSMSPPRPNRKSHHLHVLNGHIWKSPSLLFRTAP